MMHAIKNKLTSRRGASITFALLLFLVCAVIGSAVLTAGTVAAGRMSKVAEMDQRYYSVNSAARLLIAKIESDIIRIKKEPIEGNGSSISYKYYFEDDTPITDTDSFDSIAKYAAARIVTTQPSSFPLTVQLALSPTSDTADTKIKDALTVTIKETIYQNGNIEFIITKSDAVSGTTQNNYSLQLIFVNTEASTDTESVFHWKLSEMRVVDQPSV